MYSKDILISSIDKAKKFLNIVSTYTEDIDLVEGRYVVDAKSIMGIFCLDLTKKLKVYIHTDDVELANKLLGELKDAGICYE